MRWNPLPLVLLTPVFAAGIGVSTILERLDPELHDRLTAEMQRREVAEERLARLMQYKASLEKDISDVRQNYADLRKSLKKKELVLAMLEEPGVNSPRILEGPP